jgi:LemA protein
MSGILVFIAVLALVAFAAIGIYNRIVGLNQRANQAFSDVDVQLRQRHDLVPNLVEAVKGYASHEKATLDAVISARGAAAAAQGPAQQASAEAMLSGALGRLMAVAEAYPDLKANANFMELQRQLADLENKIAAARRFFNNAVQEFNTAIEQIPGNLIAPLGQFKRREFFETPAELRGAVDAPPAVKF